MKHQQSAVRGAQEAATRKKPVQPAPKGDAQHHSGPPPSGDGREEMIRRTAYAFYEARGCVAGHELDDWLQAEAQIVQASAAQASASPLAQAA